MKPNILKCICFARKKGRLKKISLLKKQIGIHFSLANNDELKQVLSKSMQVVAKDIDLLLAFHLLKKQTHQQYRVVCFGINPLCFIFLNPFPVAFHAYIICIYSGRLFNVKEGGIDL